MPVPYESTMGSLGGEVLNQILVKGLTISERLLWSGGSKRALESVGLWDTFQAAQLDRCIWNYQTDSSCRADLDCRHVLRQMYGYPFQHKCASRPDRKGWQHFSDFTLPMNETTEQIFLCRECSAMCFDILFETASFPCYV